MRAAIFVLPLLGCGDPMEHVTGDAASPDAVTPAKLVAYASGNATEITWFDVARGTGALSRVSAVAAFGANPSFLAVDPAAARLYAVSETTSRVGGYAIDPASGALSFINDAASAGTGPAHVFVDRSGRYVLVANYGNGVVAVFAIQSTGALAAAQQTFVAGANAHMIITDPSNHYAFVPCLGSDWVAQYLFDPTTGMLTPNAVPHLTTASNAGPRHLAFAPNGAHAYLINEKASTLTALAFDGVTGRLSEIQTVSTLPAGFTGTNTTAEVWVHPSGAYVFGSNRGDDSIVTFARDLSTGRLTLIGHTKTQGMTPRDFTLAPDGKFLYAANQSSNTIVPFALDPATGTLSMTASSVDVQAPTFIGITALP